MSATGYAFILPALSRREVHKTSRCKIVVPNNYSGDISHTRFALSSVFFQIARLLLTYPFSRYTVSSMENRKIHKIHEKFGRVVDLVNELEKPPRTFGTDQLLTPSEIHLVEIVGDREEMLGVTEIAGVLGVTKGAVSQNVKRLLNKGLVYKEQDPGNLSRVVVKLTSQGKVAYYSHKHWHETMDGGFKEYFHGLGEDKIDFLLDFLDRLEDFLKRAMA